MTSTITVGFTTRERFALGAQALEALYASTSLPFRLIFVDANIPPRYRAQADAVLKGKPNVDVLRHDAYLLPNQARNLVVKNCREDYVLFVESDCLLQEGCLDRLLGVAEKNGADVVAPVLYEGPASRGYVHHDRNLAGLIVNEDGTRTCVRDKTRMDNLHRLERPEPIVFFEEHCALFRRKIFDRIGPLNETLNSAEHIDLSLDLHAQKAVVYLAPAARACFHPPPPVLKDELPFYRFRWDKPRADASRAYVWKRWRLTNEFQGGRFASGQRYRTSRWSWRLYQYARQLGKALGLSRMLGLRQAGDTD